MYLTLLAWLRPIYIYLLSPAAVPPSYSPSLFLVNHYPQETFLQRFTQPFSYLSSLFHPSSITMAPVATSTEPAGKAKYSTQNIMELESEYSA